MSKDERPILQWDDEPQATYPGMQPEDSGLDPYKICRACHNGEGDGICGYHHHKFQQKIRRYEKVNKL